MKKQTGIWIDTSKAIIVSLHDGKDHMKEIESDIDNSVYHDKEGDKGTFSGSNHHHGDNETRFEERKKNQMNQFLKDVIDHVKSADELYIFGPAEAKTKLKQKLNDKCPIEASKLKAVEVADHMTHNQIVAQVKQFYNSNPK